MITQTYNLNLIPDKVPVIVNCSQYDANSRTIEMTIYDGSVLYAIPSGTTASVRGTKEDNTGFEYPCTISGSKVSFDIQDQMTLFAGKVPCEIRLTDSNGIIGTCNFLLNVEETPLDPDVTISETDLPLLEEAEQNAVRAEQAADRAEELLDDVVLSVDNILPDTNGNVDLSSKFNAKQDVLTAGEGIRMSSSSELSNTFTTLSEVNLDDIKYNYRGFVLRATNQPSGQNANGVLDSIFSLTSGGSLSHGMQIYKSYLSDADLFVRRYNVNNNTWSAWALLNPGNDLLWTNSNPGSQFAGQTLTLDSSKYSSLLIVFRVLSSSTYHQSIVVKNNGYDQVVSGVLAGNTTICARAFTPSADRIVFNNGYAGATQDNARMIPRFIYGIR